MYKHRPVIDSPANPFVKRLVALKNEKGREASGEFLLEGQNVVDSIPGGWPVSCYAVSESYIAGGGGADAARLPLAGRAEVYVLSDRAFKKVSDTVNPQGVLAVCHRRTSSLEECAGREDGFLLFGEKIADPGNLGAVIRTAAAAGCHGVVLSEGCVSAYNPKTLRAAAGALFRVPVVEGAQTGAALEVLAGLGYTLAASHVAGGVSHYAADFTKKCCILIGNEANGLSEAALNRAHIRVRIPMSPDVESLNASVACGILLYEAVRQRMAKNGKEWQRMAKNGKEWQRMDGNVKHTLGKR